MILFVYVTELMNHITYTYYNKRYILCLDHLFFLLLFIKLITVSRAEIALSFMNDIQEMGKD